MRKKELKVEKYQEDDFDELLNYDEENLESLIDEEDEIENKKIKKNKPKYIRVINIIFYVIILLMIMVTVDVVCVAKYNKGPFFAIKVATYKDGGTKVYYGLGYKVIKYNELEGRKDTVIGSWLMKYDTEPVEVQALDLAIEYKNDTLNTYKKLSKKYLSITGTFKSYDQKNNKLIFGYEDPDNSYTLDIVCTTMAEENKKQEFTENEKLIVLGTVEDFKLKDDKNPNTLYISNCFVK